MIPLVVASQNVKKLEELHAILSDLPLQLISLRHLKGAPQVEEHGETFEANAIEKAITIARWCQKLTLADDSGLCVDALGGAPGIYSARFAGESKNDSANCDKLLQAMENIPEPQRSASFICAVAIAVPDQGLVEVTKGEYRGHIGFDKKGSYGFGYDPLFIDPASGKRFAELPPDIKNKISHRALALAKAKEILSSYLGTRLPKSDIDKPRNVI